MKVLLLLIWSVLILESDINKINLPLHIYFKYSFFIKIKNLFLVFVYAFVNSCIFRINKFTQNQK